MLTADLFSTKLLTGQLFCTLCSCILCTLLFWSLGNGTFPCTVYSTFFPNHFSNLPRLYSFLTVSFNITAPPPPPQFHIICKFSNYNPEERMKSTNESTEYYWSRTDPADCCLPPWFWEWITRYSEQTAFALLILETQLFSRYKYYDRNLLLYFPKQICNRHSNCSQNNTQIPLNTLLKFILAETNRAIYQLLTRGPLSQALSENVCLYMSRCILPYMAVKMNMLLTNVRVENFDGPQKIQWFSPSTTCKARDYEYNYATFVVR